MTLLYDIIFILFSILYLPYLIFTGRYHKELWQRFGLYPKDIIERLKNKEVIWIHAVSVGEVMAARGLCEATLEKYPEGVLVISTITKTGNKIAKKFLKDRATILFLPVDISYVLNKVLDRIRPKLFIIVETEIWPNLIIALHKRKIPILLVNGRISPKSYKHYMQIGFLIKGILSRIDSFCMQSDEYRQRIIDMGAPRDRVVVTGNMKFDAASTEAIRDRLDTDAIKSDLNLAKDEPLFIAGSTHRPEEEIILGTYKNLLKDIKGLRLLIAPRHIERASEIEGIVRRLGFAPIKISKIAKSESVAVKDSPPVLILDTMGRLYQIFSIATIVFMGGSLMRKGGQNILEPAIFSKPIIFGPHMFNFKDIKEAFLKGDAACMVKDKDELLETTDLLLKDLERRQELGRHARDLIEKNRGATKRNADEITRVLV